MSEQPKTEPMIRRPTPKTTTVIGPLTEDLSTVGGLDEDGAPVIRARRPGALQEDRTFKPTDPRERLHG